MRVIRVLISEGMGCAQQPTVHGMGDLIVSWDLTVSASKIACE
jgi:hypothetical protein